MFWIGIIIISLIVLVILFLLLVRNTSTINAIIFENERKISQMDSQLKLANLKFMKGKISKNVFEELKLDFESKKTFFELENNKLKEIDLPGVSKKVELIYNKLDKPTRYKKIHIQNLVYDSELIRKEMKSLENKLLKGAMDQKTFEKLIALKENDLISKEAELIDFVRFANGKNANNIIFDDDSSSFDNKKTKLKK
ncbi:MAG: hypothetical protein PHQ98_00725 [Candidatus ainarchaeum sp.]|nr:hypothetical protein [Candidatus ainarchaeum sp.]